MIVKMIIWLLLFLQIVYSKKSKEKYDEIFFDDWDDEIELEVDGK